MLHQKKESAIGHPLCSLLPDMSSDSSRKSIALFLILKKFRFSVIQALSKKKSLGRQARNRLRCYDAYDILCNWGMNPFAKVERISVYSSGHALQSTAASVACGSLDASLLASG
jgi:hypothetical protein